jgi:hypothetical protein
MNFFTIDSNSPGGHLRSSKDLWIYFAIAVPLTTIVMCFWWWWQKIEDVKARDIEGGFSNRGVDKSSTAQSAV